MLTNLKRLYLGGNQISDIIVLKDLIKLESLNISDCLNISYEEEAELQRALPNLKIER
jgi:Leucine-rich repeat (LRR) protein